MKRYHRAWCERTGLRLSEEADGAGHDALAQAGVAVAALDILQQAHPPGPARLKTVGDLVAENGEQAGFQTDFTPRRQQKSEEEHSVRIWEYRGALSQETYQLFRLKPLNVLRSYFEHAHSAYLHDLHRPCRKQCSALG